jgi:hypothetical protein
VAGIFINKYNANPDYSLPNPQKFLKQLLDDIETLHSNISAYMMALYNWLNGYMYLIEKDESKMRRIISLANSMIEKGLNEEGELTLNTLKVISLLCKSEASIQYVKNIATTIAKASIEVYYLFI